MQEIFRTSSTSSPVYGPAQDYCKKKRAMLIIDSPDDWIDKDKAKNNIDILDVVPARTSSVLFGFLELNAQIRLMEIEYRNLFLVVSLLD